MSPRKRTGFEYGFKPTARRGKSGPESGDESNLNIRSITKEFYDVGQDGARMENQAEKAKKLLEYIEHRISVHERETGKPFSAHERNAFGFDIEELKQGRIRAAPQL